MTSPIKLDHLTVLNYALEGLRAEYAGNYEILTDKEHEAYEKAVAELRRRINLSSQGIRRSLKS